jgi:hypothetical protein
VEVAHRCFESAASGWTEEDLAAKRRARSERERAYLTLRGALARLGAVELLEGIDKLAFRQRIEEIADFVRHSPSVPPPPRWAGGASRASGPARGEGQVDGRAHS